LGRIFGYSRDELAGQSLLIIIPEKYRDAHAAGVKRYLDGGRPKIFGHGLELEGLRKDGSVFPVELKIHETKLEEAADRLFTAAIRDIAERLSALAGRQMSKLAEAERRKRTEQIIRQQTALLEFAKMNGSSLDATLNWITAVDSKTLGLERVRVWFFSGYCSEIICENLRKLSGNSHEKELKLQAKQYPGYFKMLEKSNIIAAIDARTNPANKRIHRGVPITPAYYFNDGYSPEGGHQLKEVNYE